MSLAVYNSEVVTEDTANIEFPNQLDAFIHWIIEWTSDGYVIKSAETPTLCLQIENASTDIGATASVGSDSGTQNCRWGLEAVLTPRSGVLFYDTENDIVCYDPTKYVAPEEVIFLDDLGIEPTYYSHDEINQDFVWSSSDTSIATVNSSGSITGVSYGTVTITATHVLSSRSASYTLQVTGIPNGTYFIRNKQTGCYADIQGPTMADGTTIHQWKFNGNNSQKWIFEHQGDGFYTVRSANSTGAYYLGVLNDDSTVNTDIVLRNGEVTFGMLWNVSVTSSGAFKLTAKKGYALDYALATTTSNDTNGAKLVHGQYMPNNNSYCDEWEFMSEFSIALYGIPDEDEDNEDNSHDHLSALEAILNMGGISNYCFFNRSVSVAELKDGLSTKDIFISRSHGNYIPYANSNTVSRTGILLTDPTSSSTNNVWLWSHYNSNMASNSSYLSDDEDYSNISIALFVACYTGMGDTSGRNLPAKAVLLGAEVAVGFMVNIDCDDSNTWTVTFWQSMLNGANVNTAVNEACEESNISSDDVTVCGNGDYKLMLQ